MKEAGDKALGLGALNSVPEEGLHPGPEVADPLEVCCRTGGLRDSWGPDPPCRVEKIVVSPATPILTLPHGGLGAGNSCAAD